MFVGFRESQFGDLCRAIVGSYSGPDCECLRRDVLVWTEIDSPGFVVDYGALKV